MTRRSLLAACFALALAAAIDDIANAPPPPAYLAEHNAKRALHVGTPAVLRSAVLEAQAAEYAATCPTGHASRQERLGAGENLYWAGGSALAGEETSYAHAVQSWYDEMGSYNFSTGQTTTGGVIGHFTQVVWKGSTEIGCAVKLDCANMWTTEGFGTIPNSVVVCRYNPPGNYRGEYTRQVAPLLLAAAVEDPEAFADAMAGGHDAPTGEAAAPRAAAAAEKYVDQIYRRLTW